MDKPKISSKPMRLIYFWSGIVATFAYRVIIVLTGFDQFWTKLVWYVGTIGFSIYFIHRYQISNKREKAVEEFHLDDKLPQIQGMSEEDKSALKYIFDSLKVSSERWIFIWIFITSGAALLAGIYLDFIAK